MSDLPRCRLEGRICQLHNDLRVRRCLGIGSTAELRLIEDEIAFHEQTLADFWPPSAREQFTRGKVPDSTGGNAMVRAKMTVSGITERSWGGKEIEFSCQYDPAIPEDQRFQKATPSGSIKMQIDNPAVLEQFKLGKPYYVDFTPAEG